MAIFHQDNQNIHGSQYNIGGDFIVNFGEVKEKSELPAELHKIIIALTEAEKKGLINANVSRETQRQVQESIDEVNKTNPDSKNIIEKLNGAKTLIEGIASASGLIKIFIEAADMARKFFG